MINFLHPEALLNAFYFKKKKNPEIKHKNP